MTTRHLAAPLWRRTLAALLDMLAPMTVWIVATWAIVSSDPEPVAIPAWNLFDLAVDYLHDRPWRVALSFAVLIVTQVAWPVAFAGATPGKRVLDVALLDAHGRPPSRARCLVWSLWRVPSLWLAGAGAWWALVDPERRTLHDRLARLWLVRASVSSAEAATPAPADVTTEL